MDQDNGLQPLHNLLYLLAELEAAFARGANLPAAEAERAPTASAGWQRWARGSAVRRRMRADRRAPIRGRRAVR